MATLGDISKDLEDLKSWAEEMRAAFAGDKRSTVLVRGTPNWRETPPTISVRPPRTTVCFCIPKTKKDVTAGDLADALERMRDWLGVLSNELKTING